MIECSELFFIVTLSALTVSMSYFFCALLFSPGRNPPRATYRRTRIEPSIVRRSRPAQTVKFRKGSNKLLTDEFQRICRLIRVTNDSEAKAMYFAELRLVVSALKL